MPSGDCFSFAEDEGMIETMVDLGEAVGEGQAVARIHPIEPHGPATPEIRAKISGMLTPGISRA